MFIELPGGQRREIFRYNRRGILMMFTDYRCEIFYELNFVLTPIAMQIQPRNPFAIFSTRLLLKIDKVAFKNIKT